MMRTPKGRQATMRAWGAFGPYGAGRAELMLLPT